MRKQSQITDKKKIAQYVELGFTADEAEAMVEGSTHARTRKKLGGVWFVGNVAWVQAISAIHARKLHTWVFGKIDPDEETRLICEKDGAKWEVEKFVAAPETVASTEIVYG